MGEGVFQTPGSQEDERKRHREKGAETLCEYGFCGVSLGFGGSTPTFLIVDTALRYDRMASVRKLRVAQGKKAQGSSVKRGRKRQDDALPFYRSEQQKTPTVDDAPFEVLERPGGREDRLW